MTADKHVEEVFLSDANGKILLRATGSEGKFEFDLSHFPVGLYFIRCEVAEKIQAERLVVQR